jgi:hypothetical protein
LAASKPASILDVRVSFAGLVAPSCEERGGQSEVQMREVRLQGYGGRDEEWSLEWRPSHLLASRRSDLVGLDLLARRSNILPWGRGIRPVSGCFAERGSRFLKEQGERSHEVEDNGRQADHSMAALGSPFGGQACRWARPGRRDERPQGEAGDAHATGRSPGVPSASPAQDH